MTTPFRTATATVERLLHEVQQADGVSTDTRDALGGLVFWALTGARFDGNDFVEAALKQGAAHVVSNRADWHDDPRVTVVEDVLDALQATARALRRTWDCPVLALTGSNGKTTTKELLRDVLAEGMEVHATSGNFNNHIGVPLTLLRAPAHPEFVVVEMGANHQQEIALLCTIAEPSHGCITNIGLAHLEGFGGEEGVYKGKKELFDHLAATHGTAFVNTADPKVERAAKGVGQNVLISSKGWTWTSSPEDGPATVGSPSGASFTVHLEGDYNLMNVATAWAVGRHFGISEEACNRALSNYMPSNHRSQVVRTERNWVLLDAYNANPSSVAHALASFASKGHPHPLVVLGGMAELGEASDQAHLDTVKDALGRGLELWTVGQAFGRVPQQAGQARRHFDQLDALVAHVKAHPLEGRQILVKGSRSAQLEKLMPSL